MIKVLLLILIVLMFCLAVFGASGTTIQGGKIAISGGYAYTGPSQTAVVVSTSSTVGQCLGILCGITKSN